MIYFSVRFFTYIRGKIIDFLNFFKFFSKNFFIIFSAFLLNRSKSYIYIWNSCFKLYFFKVKFELSLVKVQEVTYISGILALKFYDFEILKFPKSLKPLYLLALR